MAAWDDKHIPRRGAQQATSPRVAESVAAVFAAIVSARRSNDRANAQVHLRRFPAELFTERYLINVASISSAARLALVRRVAVGSTNPVKIDAVRAVFALVAPQATVEGVGVASSVPDQPRGDDETIRGARVRAAAARDALGADIGVGIEGGIVEERDGAMRTCAWAAIVDATGKSGVGGSLAMPLPDRVAASVRDGLELGHAMDALIGAHDTKRGQGAVGILTAGLVDRQRAYEVLVSYALAPFVTADLFDDGSTDSASS